MKQHASKINYCLLFIFCFAVCSLGQADNREAMQVSFRVESLKSDGMFHYYQDLLDLVLRETENDYGPYTIKLIHNMNFLRAQEVALNNRIDNFIFNTSYSSDIAKLYTFVPFPIDQGAMSYRVCFTNTQRARDLKTVTTLDELRLYSMGQGKNWLDIEVLQENGFKVSEQNYITLFPSVARGRFDLFCRSIVEIYPEWQAHKHVENLIVDPHLLIYYPFPRFFWTNTNNRLLVKRLSEGLKLSLENGKARSLWEKHHRSSIDFVKLDTRTLIRLNNPQLKSLDLDFEKYFYLQRFQE